MQIPFPDSEFPPNSLVLFFLLLFSLETATLLRNSKIFAMLKQGGKS